MDSVLPRTINPMNRGAVVIAVFLNLALVVAAPSQEKTSPALTPNHDASQEVVSKVRPCSSRVPPPCANAPSVIKAPNPEYSEEAQKKRIVGTVILWLIVGSDGLPHDIRVSQPLGYGLDEEAIKAVKKWKFNPATVSGQPVAVQINVNVAFRLHK
jgi:TonB family protein